LQGAPNYQLVTGTSDLLWVSNTESDVFRMGKAGPVYFLVAGRWFSSPGFTGPVDVRDAEHAGAIQADSPRTSAFARAGSRPGHRSGAEAVLLASIRKRARQPQRGEGGLSVAYQGDPKFEPIPSTSVAARRQHRQGHHQGRRPLLPLLRRRVVRVESADRAMGRGRLDPEDHLRDSREFPSHSVTYVTVEDSNDEWVTFAAAAAFTA